MKPNIIKQYIVKNSYERYLLHDMCKTYDKILSSLLQQCVISDISSIIVLYCTTKNQTVLHYFRFIILKDSDKSKEMMSDNQKIQYTT